ncbi:MAG: TIGR03564 family F420-dependent LLM class oxidoreductase [Tepidiformaceae bacterium]
MLSMPGDAAGTAELVARAVRAEEAGFDSVWLPQVGTVDALMTLALAGGSTSRIEMGTSVVPTYPRHPTVLAQQALTAQDATGGRLTLGIGLSHKVMIENSLGLDYSRPIPHMREYLTILNGLLAGEQVRFEGGEYRVHAQIAVAGAKRPPVVVAALGPAMLRLCGRLADGTVTWMGGIDYLRDIAVPTMSEAAKKAGKPAPRFVAMVPVLLAKDAGAGREAINTAFANYGRIPSYRATLDRGGAANPADVAVVGGEEEVEAGLRAFESVGVTDFVAVIPAAAETRTTYEFVSELARRT